jgi:hypothetical protein
VSFIRGSFRAWVGARIGLTGSGHDIRWCGARYLGGGFGVLYVVVVEGGR